MFQAQEVPKEQRYTATRIRVINSKTDSKKGKTRSLETRRKKRRQSPNQKEKQNLTTQQPVSRQIEGSAIHSYRRHIAEGFT
jgi:hypothetical protein